MSEEHKFKYIYDTAQLILWKSCKKPFLGFWRRQCLPYYDIASLPFFLATLNAPALQRGNCFCFCFLLVQQVGVQSICFWSPWLSVTLLIWPCCVKTVMIKSKMIGPLLWFWIHIIKKTWHSWAENVKLRLMRFLRFGWLTMWGEALPGCMEKQRKCIKGIGNPIQCSLGWKEWQKQYGWIWWQCIAMQMVHRISKRM